MNIALIEIVEEDVPKLGVPFTLYGVYKAGSNKKLKAAFLQLAELRRQMAEQHKLIEALQASEDPDQIKIWS